MPTPRNSTRPGTRTRLATSEASRPADSSAPTMRMRSPSCTSTPFHTPARVLGGSTRRSTSWPVDFGRLRGDRHLTSVRTAGVHSRPPSQKDGPPHLSERDCTRNGQPGRRRDRIERRAAAGGAGLQAGAGSQLERVPELRDLVHHHLDPGRVLHDLRPGVEQRRPRRDLVGLAADLDPDPDHRLLHVGAGVGLPDRGRHLLVGRQARRRRLGLVHGLVQPHRVDRRVRVGRLRRGDVPEHASSGCTTSTCSTGPRRTRPRSSTARSSCSWSIIAFHAAVNILGSHLVATFNSISVWWHVAGVARHPRRADLRPRTTTRRPTSSSPSASTTRASAAAMYWFYVLPLGFLLTQYTITGFDSCAHISEETHGAADAAAKGVWRSIFYSRGDRLVPAAGASRSRRPTPRASPRRRRQLDRGLRVRDGLGGWVKLILIISTVGQLFCGTACLTSASRMCYAFSRDGAIPGWRIWSKVNSTEDAGQRGALHGRAARSC